MAEPTSAWWNISNDAAEVSETAMRRSVANAISDVKVSRSGLDSMLDSGGINIGAINSVVNFDRLQSDLESKLTKSTLRSARRAARDSAKKMGTAVSLEAVEKEAIRRARSVARMMTNETRKSMLRAIRRMDKEGFSRTDILMNTRKLAGLNQQQASAVLTRMRVLREGGMTRANVNKRVDRLVGRQTGARSRMVARHETKEGSEIGQDAAIQQAIDSGKIKNVRKRWVSVRDGNRDPICRRLHGQIVPHGSKFRDPGTGLRYDGPPDPHATCRCGKHLLFAKGDGEPPLFDGMTDDEILGLPPEAFPFEATRELGSVGRFKIKGGPGDLDGQWSPERTELHDAIVRKHIQGKTKVKNSVVNVLGGGPSAGKSSVKGTRLDVSENTVSVDVDAIRVMLPEWDEGEFKEDAEWNHEEASEVAKRIIEEAAGMNIVVDGTGDSSLEKLLGKIEGYRERGGKTIKGLYVTNDTDEAVRRMKKRGEETGRFVPETYMRNVHASISATLPDSIEEGAFESVELWDTNGPPFDKRGFAIPRLVMRAVGDEMEIVNESLWQRFLSKVNDSVKSFEFQERKTVAVGTDRLEIMLLRIARKQSKPKSLTPEESRVWDQMAKEVKEIRDRGDKLDIPSESPGELAPLARREPAEGPRAAGDILTARTFHAKHDQKTHGRGGGSKGKGGGGGGGADAGAGGGANINGVMDGKGVNKQEVIENGKEKLSKLEVTETMPNGGQIVRHPIPVATGISGPAHDPDTGIPSFASGVGDSSRLESIDVSKVRYVTQDTIVKDIAARKIDGLFLDQAPIHVIKSKDQFLLMDGHHRVSANILTGKKKIKARIWE